MSSFGLSKKVIADIKSILKKYNIKKASIYGSRAMGNFKNGSDIDICLFGKIDLLTKHKIENELDELMLPYTIDISIYQNIKNRDLKKHIDTKGITL